MTPIIAFDVGGTWFRSARFAAGRPVSDIRRTAAINQRAEPRSSIEALQESLIAYLGQEALRLGSAKDAVASVSLGAAINARTGQVLNASTLWGSDFTPFPLRERLEQRYPQFRWVVNNDITCAAVSAARSLGGSARRVGLYTISTGIGCRTVVRRPDLRVPLHPNLGIQGEVGHFTIPPLYGGTLGDFVCDCGGKNHLNAMCSGRGIERVLARVVERQPFAEGEPAFGRLAPGESATAGFVRALAAGRSAAHDVLNAVVEPVARIMAQHLCLDPEIEKVFVVGGTMAALDPFYRQALLRALAGIETYLISAFDPTYFERVMQFCVDDEVSSLHGAALLADKDAGLDAI